MIRKIRTRLSASAILIASLTLLSGVAAGQATTPESQARRFYAWYLHELNAERNPIRNSSGLRKYVTARMVRSIERALNRPEGIDADIFIDAQDFDPLWEKNITTSKAAITASGATLTVTLKGGRAFGTKRLRLGFKREAGEWKIDSVNTRTSP